MNILGIDPARGWAITSHSGQKRVVLDAGTVHDLEDMIEKIKAIVAEIKIDQVRVEKTANRHVYHRPGQSTAAMRKIAVNVGENRSKADAIIYFCKGLGLKVDAVNPIKNGTKLSAAQIKQLTGYSGRTSEHARDAIVISYCR